MNAGFKTEERHYQALVTAFGIDNVTAPRGSGNGSDFIVVSNNQIVTFESKTSNTDIFEAGCISAFSNCMIYNVSSFLSNNCIQQVSDMISKNKDQFIDYINASNVSAFPHVIHKDLFNDIKSQGKLVQMSEKVPLSNIIEDSFCGKNSYPKANYIIINNSVFLTSNNAALDPLGLKSYGAVVLNDDHIDKFTLRSARGGSRNGKVSVTLRLQYNLKRQLPISKIRLS